MRGARPATKPAAFAAFALIAGCKPDLNQTVSLVQSPEIVAIRADPAEAAPKGTIQYSALVIGSSGPVATPLQWSFCNARKPLAELGPVSPQCLQGGGDWFAPIGIGSGVSATIPADACKNFGPEVPPPMMNQPPGRPVDPDSTGGYYQPLQVVLPTPSGGDVAIAETRISCGIAGSPDQLVTFNAHYTANESPAVAALTAAGKQLAPDEGGATNPVHAGDALALEATWAACPTPTGACGDHFCDLAESKDTCPADCTMLSGCSGAETYVNLDLTSYALITQHEGIDVAWFATAGSFDSDRTGRAPSESMNSSTNTWHAPPSPGLVHMWIVLRDDRGGVGWTQYALQVQ